ncbi:MAG: glycosyltransferase [Kiritimatiellae bacterium]|nr:glycosyltransferase [Kiritimatiellia bacterium]
MADAAKKEDPWEAAARAARAGGVSVVMPVFNLAASVEKNVLDTARLFEEHGVPAELVPVDDGSTDGTGAALERLAERRPAGGAVAIRPVVCAKNGGKGAALRAGFDASSGEYILLLDGDLDISPAMTPGFFAEMERSGADVVVGSKRHPGSKVQYPWHRRVASAAYFALVRLFIGLPLTDTQTGMKLFRRKTLGDALGRMLVKTYAFDLELLAIAFSRGAKISEAPVSICFGSKFGALGVNTVKTMAMDTLAVFYRLKILKYYDKAEVPPKMDSEPLVSVVIACPGDSAMLRECLAGVARQTYAKVETIVLPDGPLELPGVRVVPTGKVRPAEKRNAGMREAKGSIIAFIDDDAWPDANWIAYAVKYFGDESVGAVGGPGVTPPGDGFLARAGGRVYDCPLVSGGYRYRYKAGGVRRDVDDYPSCNLFVRSSLLRLVGGYRTDFWPGEDTLLCKDVIDAGKRIVYDPWVIVHHHRRALFGPHLRQLGRYAFHRGYFCRKYPSNSLHLPYFVPTAFVAYLAAWLPAAAAAVEPGTALWYSRAAFLAPLPLYGAAVLAATFSLNPAMWLLTAAGVIASHVVYGVRFAAGLVARKAPCEFIGKDHPAA